MKKRKIDLSWEKKTITHMIMNDRFIKDIYTVVNPKHFKSTYAQHVSKWVIEYFLEFKEAPKDNITDLYSKKQHLIRDEEDTENIYSFLKNLSDEYDPSEFSNYDFLLKNCINYLKTESLRALKDEIEFHISKNNPATAEQAIANYSRVERPVVDGVNLLEDAALISEAFTAEDEIMFCFPGVLGEVVGNFQRGDLVAYLAFAKKGKTFWQMYTALTSLYHGYKAVFYSLEMPLKQITRRAWQGLTGQARVKNEYSYAKFVKRGDLYSIEEDWIQSEEVNPSVEKIKKDQQKMKMHLMSKGIEIVSMPAFSCTVGDIETHLDNLIYYKNFEPDVVVVDYADCLVAQRKGEYRHQIDEIWKSLRRMAHERNILVVTASQAGRSAAKKDAEETDIAEDIRKIAHVSKMISINQSKEDHDRKIMRIKQLAEREGQRSFRDACVSYCLQIGKPHINAIFYDQLKQKKMENNSEIDIN